MPPEHTLSDRKVTQDLDSGHELEKKKKKLKRNVFFVKGWAALCRLTEIWNR